MKFTVARIIGLFIRPLSLLIAMHIGFERSDDIATLFVMIGTVVAILNCDLHKYFYVDNHYRSYIKKLVSHFIIVFPIVLVYTVITSDSFIVFFAIMYGYAEKICDELQRYYIYNHKDIDWLQVCSVRYYIPSLLLIIQIYFNVQISIILISFILYNAIFLYYLISKWRKTFLNDFEFLDFDLKEYTNFVITGHWKVLIYSVLLSFSIIYLRNLLIINPESADIYLLLFMGLFSIYTIYDAAVFTKLKKEWLETKVVEMKCIRLILVVFSILLLSADLQIQILNELLQYEYNNEITIIYYNLIVSVALYTILIPYSQVNYWAECVQKLILIEILPIVAVLMSLLFTSNQVDKIIMFNLYLFARLFLNIYVYKKNK